MGSWGSPPACWPAPTGPAASLAIIVGHLLNILAFLIAGLLPATQLAVTIFSVGLLVETVIDIVVIVLAVAMLRPVVPATAV